MSRDWAALYALQDSVLNAIAGQEHGFYLTGGTALGRGYYQHRYSEDLDFFSNDSADFVLWRDRCMEAIRRTAGFLDASPLRQRFQAGHRGADPADYRLT
jgi:predicted nucleotidyltransferase component of viral defense system